MFLFGFRRFIAPTVIKGLYFVSIFFAFFGGAGVVIYALAEMKDLGTHQAVGMIAAAAIGTPLVILFSRFVTEIWLVLFEMNERLGDIRDK